MKAYTDTRGHILASGSLFGPPLDLSSQMLTLLRIVLLGWPQPQYHTKDDAGRAAEGNVSKGEQRRSGGESWARGG